MAYRPDISAPFTSLVGSPGTIWFLSTTYAGRAGATQASNALGRFEGNHQQLVSARSFFEISFPEIV